MKLSRLALLLLFLLPGLLLPTGTAAQSPERVSGVQVDYSFGEQIDFTGRIDPALDFETASIQLEFSGDSATLTAALQPGPDGGFAYTHFIQDRFVQAFSEVTFRFVLEQAGGGILISEPYVFFYTDNRYTWQVLEKAPFRVHWYEGDLAYAQQVLDAAEDGYARARIALQTGEPEAVDIYLYAALADYRYARGQLGQLWAGGHADPASGLVLAAVPPGAEAQLEIERKIPHEIAHLALFQATGAGYWNLPAWLNEGFASMLETYPNPDYEYLVANAANTSSLAALESLCEPFARESSAALLAYAQSTSVVRYVTDMYGSTGLQALVEAYASGAGCSQGTLVEPVGLALADLDAAWRESLDNRDGGLIDPNDGPGKNSLLPLLFVFAAVLLGPLVVLAGIGRRKGVGDG